VIRPEAIPPLASAPVASTDLPRNSTSHHVAEEMRRLARRARELELVEPEIEQRESLWREMTAQERLSDLRRFVNGGRLLEIGCSTGDLLSVANGSFNSTGVEADLAAGSVARARGIDCFSGTLFDARFNDEEFDLAAMYHVIEHLPSPRQTLQELHRILRRDGWLAIETPNIATPWVSLLGPRWRQFIPDHIYFFSPETITRLCHETGFEIRELRSAGKAMSVRLFLSRLGRYHKGLARGFAALSHRLGMNERTLRLNLGDVMRIYAQKR
jgi:2-polyprenyl-3-methyl-5-hydroxy-6-metoxy-1,4-benzoquinol methylase